MNQLPSNTRKLCAAAGLAAITLFSPLAIHAQCLRTVNVSNDAALASALSSALPGDCIVLANGNYAGTTVTHSGTAANPITIKAANPGQAFINSGVFNLNNCSFVVVQGLGITTPGGTLTIDGTSRAVGMLLQGAVNCRVTKCTFVLNQAGTVQWCFLSGTSKSNRIDHCEFGPDSGNNGSHMIWPCGNSTISGVSVPSDRTAWALGYGAFNPNMARYTQIDHNYFHDQGSQTAETIVLGAIGTTGDYQDTFSLVEYNLFVNCDGDPEIVSVKSSSNTLRYNTVRTSAGVFSLRAGNSDSVYGNFFLCAGKGGGVKLSERDHKVYDNYMENTDGSSYPIMLEGGDLYNAGFSHAQVVRAQIAHNTAVGSGRNVLFAHNGGLPVTDTVFANNIVTRQGGADTIYSESSTSVNCTFAQNIAWTGANPNRTGFLFEDPQFATVNGLQKLSAGSPAINAASPNYFPYVGDDQDGQLRDVLRDIGADEFAGGFSARGALTVNEVGPNAVDLELAASPLSQTVSVGATNVSYAITVTADVAFTDPVTLTLNGLPPGMTAGFTPASVNGSGVVTLNVTNSSAVPGGAFPLAVTATSSNLATTLNVLLQVGRTAANLRWADSGAGAWDIQATSNWINRATSIADSFHNGDTVLLDDTAGVQTNITIGPGVAVVPSTLTNNSSANQFTIGGAGKISGAARLVKQGGSTLTLNAPDDFGGGIAIQAGTVKLGNAFAAGGAGAFVIATNGGTLDVNGNNIGEATVLASGAGVGGNGAVVNNGADVFPAFPLLFLAGDTTIGGTHRWDLRAGNNSAGSLSTSGQGRTLTKTGTNFIGLVNVTVDPALGNINLLAGTLDIEGATTCLGNPNSTLTVSGGATLFLFNTVYDTNFLNLNKIIALNDGAILQNGSGANALLGPATLNGNDTFNIGGTSLAFSNKLQGAGNLVKTGSGVLYLANHNPYSGNTTISNGTLVVASLGSISNSATISLASGATLLVAGKVKTGAGGIVSTSSGGTLAVNGGTLTAINGPLGTPALPLGNLALTNAAVQLAVAAGVTNATTTALSLGAASTITITAFPTNFPAQYPLIDYTTLNGAMNLALTPLAGGYIAFLSNNTANSSIDLVVLSPSTFSLSAAPPSQIAPSGGALVNYTVTVTTNSGFNGSVALSVSGLPANTTAGFTPPGLSASGSSTLAVTTTAATPVGTYPLAISGANNGVTNTTTVTLGVGRTAANLRWASTSGAAWDVTSSPNWFNLDAGVADLFFQGDSVLFDDTAGVVTTVTLGVAVAPSVVTNDSSANNFSISGAGKITGAASIVKSGSSTLTLSTTNDFSGAIVVLGGILKAGCTNALGATSGSTFATNGGTLDLNGVQLVGEPIVIAGAGAGGNGALVNNGAQQTTALRNLTLAGDATIGGTGRWDMRGTGPSLLTGGQPWSLTKVGTNQVSLVGVGTIDAALADVDIQQGSFAIQTSTAQLGDPARTITVHGGATLNFFTLSAPLNKNIDLQDEAIVFDEKGPSFVKGVITLEGDAWFNTALNGAPPTLNCSNAIIGPGNLFKTNGGTLVLAGTNSYTGTTLVSTGALALVGSGAIPNSAIITVGAGALLDASGRNDATFTLAAGQTLSGRGAIRGNVTIAGGATLSPNNSFATLAFSNALTLSAGSTTVMEVGKAPLTNDVLQIAGALTNGGVLAITNLGVALAAGDSFKLFNAASYAGAFSSVAPPMPGSGLAWDLSGLTNGTLRVIAASRPQIAGIALAGTDVVISGSNGVLNGNYFVLQSTNVSLPLAGWTITSTGAFDASGNFQFTNAVDPAAPQQFYLLQLP